MSALTLNHELTDDARRALAAHWSRQAERAHASVATFARFSLQLMAVAAPADLAQAAHGAALEEIEHARLAFRLASRFAGHPVGPGPMAFGDCGPAQASLTALAVGTVRGGCVGDTVAAAEAVARLSRARDLEVSTALAVIVRDTERQAELAWRTVRWALEQEIPTVRAAITEAFAEGMAAVLAQPVARELPDQAELLADYGLLPPRECARIRKQAIDDGVRPALAALTARRASVYPTSSA